MKQHTQYTHYTHRTRTMKQHIETFIHGEERESEAIVQLEELLSARRERCVHLRRLPVRHLLNGTNETV